MYAYCPLPWCKVLPHADQSPQDEGGASKEGEPAKVKGGDAKQQLTPKEVLTRIYAARVPSLLPATYILNLD